MTRTRLFIAALLLGCGLLITSSAAEARPIYVRPAVAARSIVVAPRIGPRVAYPGHFRNYYYGHRWYR